MNASLRGWLGERLLPSRHTTYYEVRDAVAQEGCPICRLVSRAVSWYLDMLSYEAVNDPGVRARMRAARGFCNRHAWQFTREVRNGAGRAMLYRDVLRPLLESLAAPLAVADGLADRLLPAGECPACHSLEQSTHRYLETLLQHLPEGDFRQGYLASQGLCLPHLCRALRRVRRIADVELFLGVAGRRVASIGVASRQGLGRHTAAIVASIAGQPGAIAHGQPAPVALEPAGDPPPAPGLDQVEPADRGDGCPVCRAAAAAADECLALLPSACRARGPDAEPAAGLTICSPHAWRLLERVPPGRAARVWQPAARGLRGALATAAGAARAATPDKRARLSREGMAEGPGAAAARALAPSRPCPACRARAEAEERSTLARLEGLRGRDGPEARHGSPLCLPHLALALRLSPAWGARRALVAEQRATLRALGAELDEYIRKQDFRCHEARGTEADSPWRVVSQVAGAAELEAGALMWAPRRRA